MIKVSKIKRKNPETANFHQYQKGYHVTTENNLEKILKSGYLKPNSDKHLATFWEADYYGYFQKGFTPLFFASSIETLEKNFYIRKDSKVLEVDISEFKQYPDLPMFGNRAKTDKNGMYWLYSVPSQFQGRMKINKVTPFEEFFTNRRLGNSVIAYTRSVTIMDAIPTSKILNIWEGREFRYD
jgi:hypothetical protein